MSRWSNRYYVAELFGNADEGAFSARRCVGFHLKAQNDADAIAEAVKIAAWKRTGFYRVRRSAIKRRQDSIVCDMTTDAS
jgi:hypothetical protein